MNEEPLIWTIKGNISIKDTEYHVEWVDSDENITLVETYTFNDEIVKSSSHVYNKKCIDLSPKQSKF